MIIAITVAALAAMFAVLVMVAHRIERRRQAKIELALIDRIIATRRRRTAAEINAAWGEAVEGYARKARDSRITHADGTASFCLAAASHYPARHKADDCRVIGMDMAQAADRTIVQHMRKP